MLLWLTDYLSSFISVFGVFEYITFRTLVSTATALIFSMLIGPIMISRLSMYQIGEVIRDDGPDRHVDKANTPTMGGALILLVIIVTTLLWGDLGNRYVWTVLAVLAAFGIIGAFDDWLKLRRTGKRGLSAGWKYCWQSIFGLAGAVFLYLSAQSPAETELIIPFFKEISISLGVGFIALAYLMIVGMSNAVNFTDGLDGLALLPVVMISTALGLIAYLVGHVGFSDYLLLPHIPETGEITIICGAMLGAGLGFLWFNAYPAQIFMGDIGALPLGAALGTIAVIIRHEIVLLIMSGVFVLETASVMIQVAVYKIWGKRIFRMAPIHHHFELKGWPEPKIIVRFWIISLLLVMVGLATLKLR